MQTHFAPPMRGTGHRLALFSQALRKRTKTFYAPHPAMTAVKTSPKRVQIGPQCRAAASGMVAVGQGLGDRVLVLRLDVARATELSFALLRLGASNGRLQPEALAYVLYQRDPKRAIVDTPLASTRPQMVEIDGSAPLFGDLTDAPDIVGFGLTRFGDKAYLPAASSLPLGEWQVRALTRPSGTSGPLSGCVFHSLAAYPMATGTVPGRALPPHPTCQPMFHCRDCKHPWALAIVGGHLALTRDRLSAVQAARCVTDRGEARIGQLVLCKSPDAPMLCFGPDIPVLDAGRPFVPAIFENMGQAVPARAQGGVFPPAKIAMLRLFAHHTYTKTVGLRDRTAQRAASTLDAAQTLPIPF